jgi:hypothetical protein
MGLKQEEEQIYARDCAQFLFISMTNTKKMLAELAGPEA